MAQTFAQLHRTKKTLGLADEIQFSIEIDGQSDFIVEAIDGRRFEIDDIQYQLNIEVISTRGNEGHSLLGKIAKLAIIVQSERSYIYGEVIRVRSSGIHQGASKFKLVLVEPYHKFCTEKHSRVFVGKSCIAIAQGLISEGVSLASELKIEAEEQEVAEMIVQYQESDWHFLQRILAKEGVMLNVSHLPEGLAMAIVDDTAKLPQSGTVVELPFLTSRGAAVDREYVHAVTVHQQQGVNQVRLQDFNEQRSSWVLGESNQDESCQLVDYHWGSNSPDNSTAKKRATAYFQSHSGVSQQLTLSTNARSVRPGMIVNLTHHPECSGKYIVKSVSFVGSQRGAASNSDGQYREFTCLMTVIPSGVSYKPRYDSSINLTASLTARITSDVDNEGRYQIRFPFDTTSCAQSSKAVSQLQAFGGHDHGMAFPLVPDTDVVVSFINGDIDRPIILGALMSQLNPSPVTNQNPLDNIIRTRSGHELKFDDTPSAETISLATPEQKNSLLLSAEQDAHQAALTSAEGEIRIVAGTEIQASSGSDFTLTVGENYRAEIGESATFMTEQGDINFQSNESISLNAKADIRWQSLEGDLELNADGEFLLHAAEGLQQQVVSGDANIQVMDGNFQVEAGSNIDLMAGGAISISQGDGSIQIDRSGNLTLSGPTIDIVADKITIKAGTIGNN